MTEPQPEPPAGRRPAPTEVRAVPTQVAGSALAAMSGAFLASYLGTAGTIIGAVVGSLVATVGTAAYTWWLRRTSEVVKRTATQVRETGMGSTVVIPLLPGKRQGREHDARDEPARPSRGPRPSPRPRPTDRDRLRPLGLGAEPPLGQGRARGRRRRPRGRGGPHRRRVDHRQAVCPPTPRAATRPAPRSAHLGRRHTRTPTPTPTTPTPTSTPTPTPSPAQSPTHADAAAHASRPPGCPPTPPRPRRRRATGSPRRPEHAP